MNISLDYDDTYTRDPDGWDVIIAFLRHRGHKVYVVTWRHPNTAGEIFKKLDDKVDGIFTTGHQAKQSYMYKHCIRIDVWIDDMPSAILFDNSTLDSV